MKDEPIFTREKAEIYGEWLGNRYKSKGIIWVLGGDRPAGGYENIWRAMARGIVTGVTGGENYRAVLMTYHPQGGATSSTWFHNDAWLSFNMQQNGHGLPGEEINGQSFKPGKKAVNKHSGQDERCCGQYRQDGACQAGQEKNNGDNQAKGGHVFPRPQKFLIAYQICLCRSICGFRAHGGF